MGLSQRRDLAVGAAAIAPLAVPVVTLLGALHDSVAAHSKGRLHRHPLWRRLHKRILYLKHVMQRTSVDHATAMSA
jgi:hypothetical protein